jgi:hypothetical protein
MGMGYGPFISGLGDEYTATIRIEGSSEYIEKKISFSYETDTKCFIVFRLGSAAIRTAALEIQDPVNQGLIFCIDIRFHPIQIYSFIQRKFSGRHALGWGLYSKQKPGTPAFGIIGSISFVFQPRESEELCILFVSLPI